MQVVRWMPSLLYVEDDDDAVLLSTRKGHCAVKSVV